jgi:hypothetical protein
MKLSPLPLLASAGLLSLPFALQDSTPKLLERLGRLEERVIQLEQKVDRFHKAPESAPEQGNAGLEFTLIEAQVSNKSFQEIEYQDYIIWDTTYTSNDQKDIRSFKGTLIFGDLFGEPQFRVNVTVDTQLAAGKSISEEGTGNDFNMFRDEHKWLRATNLSEMTIDFQVSNVLYTDGTRTKL